MLAMCSCAKKSYKQWWRDLHLLCEHSLPSCYFVYVYLVLSLLLPVFIPAFTCSLTYLFAVLWPCFCGLQFGFWICSLWSFINLPAFTSCLTSCIHYTFRVKSITFFTLWRWTKELNWWWSDSILKIILTNTQFKTHNTLIFYSKMYCFRRSYKAM